MIRFPLAAAAAAALFLGALSTASPPSPPSHQEPNAATEAVFIVRYDPSTIHLTEELVAALCRSSVSFVVPEEGFEGLSPGETYRLDVAALPGGERQPPGVFVARAKLNGAAAEAPDAAWTWLLDQLLGRLDAALDERLVARPRGALEQSLRDQKRELQRWRDEAMALDLRATEIDFAKVRADRVDALRREVEGHKLERAVASDAWREALAKQAKADAELAEAAESARETGRRISLLKEQLASPLRGMTLEADLEQTRARLAALEMRRDQLASNAEVASAEANKRVARLEELTQELVRSTAWLEVLAADPTPEAQSDAAELAGTNARIRVEAARANRRVELLEARALELEDALARLVDVTVERW